MAKYPEKFIRCKSDEAFIEQGGAWDQKAGDRVCTFIERHLYLESGKRFTLLDWQRDFILSVYAPRRTDGRRRAKWAFLTLGRKNGKTAIVSGLTAYHLLADGEKSPKCVSCAVDREQAAQIYEGLEWSIRNNKDLEAALYPVPSRKEVQYPAGNGSYKSVSSDAAGKFGRGYSFVVYDELAFHKTDKLFAALQNSTDSRPNGLQVIISTAGWNKNGVFYRQYSHAKAILAGDVIDTAYIPWIYETPDNADLDKPETHRLANPSLGVTLDPDEFQQQWKRARGNTADKLDFLRLKFNTWTEAETTWLDPAQWDGCKGEFPDLTGAPCYLGLDCGSTLDLSALVAIFPVDDKFFVRSWGFVPRKAAEHSEKQNLIRYTQFTLDKSLRVVPGDCIDIEKDLYPFLDKLISTYDVRGLILDRWQTLQLAKHYENRGVPVTKFSQHHSMYNGPCKFLESQIVQGRLVHDGNSLLRWQVGHVILDTDSKGYVMPDKATNSQKIDNVMALCMAMSGAMQHANQPVRQRNVIEIW